MSKNDKQRALVPRLRFPEFRDDGDWHPHVFADVVQRVKTSISVEDIAHEDYVSTENLLPDFGGVGPASNLPPVSAVTQFKPGDTLFANIRPYLKKAWFATRSGGASNDVFVFRSRGQVDPRFLTQRIQSDAFVTYVMSAAKGVKMPRGDLSHIEKFPLPLPHKKREQQKIADCLGSLDDLIAAEGRKLEAMREHKQGLMQQLFPPEGETRPRLRFPAFQSDGDWAEAKLGQLSEIVRGGSPRPIDDFLTRDLDGLNWLKIGDLETGAKYVTATEDRVVPDALSKTRVIEPGDLIMSNSMSFGRPYLSQITTCIHDGWIAVRNISKRLKSEFLYYAITAPGSQAFFANWASGGGIRNLNIDIVKNLPMRHPSPAEQHRIADCLSALDALIAAQAEKLDALRAHKRGLMQQLFPSPEDTEV